jgi:nickel-type superoxide dismutase maturation protease
MKLLKSSGPPRRPKLLLVRQVIGKSMSPRLRPGQLLLAVRFVRRLHPGQVVIIQHDGKEKVKRIERIEDNKIFVIGDNLLASTDSRHFGWLKRREIIGRVIWPRVSN